MKAWIIFLNVIVLFILSQMICEYDLFRYNWICLLINYFWFGFHLEYSIFDFRLNHFLRLHSYIMCFSVYAISYFLPFQPSMLKFLVQNSRLYVNWFAYFHCFIWWYYQLNILFKGYYSIQYLTYKCPNIINTNQNCSSIWFSLINSIMALTTKFSLTFPLK